MRSSLSNTKQLAQLFCTIHDNILAGRLQSATQEWMLFALSWVGLARQALNIIAL